eukprot:833706-Pyramimonas_sp.AAC.1
MCPDRVRSVGFFRSLLDKDLKTDSASGHPTQVCISIEWQLADLRGARAESRSWDNSPPNCGQLR